jgi:hypothetical protein
MTSGGILAVAMVIVACDDFHAGDPGVNIGVVREDKDYVFSFKTCRNERVGIRWLTVTEGVTGGNEGPAHCELSTRDGSINPISGSWKYGALPPGYQMKTCQPLVPERTYEVQVVGAGGGRRVFQVRSDGSVEVREGTCSAKPLK